MLFGLFTKAEVADAVKPLEEQIKKLHDQAKEHNQLRDLIEKGIIKKLMSDKLALSRSLAILGGKLNDATKGVTVIQEAGNAMLEELRALRRLEKAVRTFRDASPGTNDGIDDQLAHVDRVRGTISDDVSLKVQKFDDAG